MKHRQHLTSWQVYADLFMFLFQWAMVLVTVMIIFFHVQSKEEKDYHPKAEYMIVLDWPDNRDVDLDLWLKNQYGSLVYYKNKELPNISLDRDSRGNITNQSRVDGSKDVRSGNEEIITIRTILPGTYQIAVVYYNDEEHKSSDHSLERNIDYTVKVIKINPTLQVVFEEQHHMSQMREVQKVVTFTIEDNGQVKIEPNSPKPFFEESRMP